MPGLFGTLSPAGPECGRARAAVSQPEPFSEGPEQQSALVLGPSGRGGPTGLCLRPVWFCRPFSSAARDLPLARRGAAMGHQLKGLPAPPRQPARGRRPGLQKGGLTSEVCRGNGVPGQQRAVVTGWSSGGSDEAV